MAGAINSGSWRTSPSSLNATLVSPIAPRASGRCCDVWAGAPATRPACPCPRCGGYYHVAESTRAHGKKSPPCGADLVCMDDTGVMLQPPVRRPGAPPGQPPLPHCWDRSERLSVFPRPCTIQPTRLCLHSLPRTAGPSCCRPLSNMRA